MLVGIFEVPDGMASERVERMMQQVANLFAEAGVATALRPVTLDPQAGEAIVAAVKGFSLMQAERPKQ